MQGASPPPAYEDFSCQSVCHDRQLDTVDRILCVQQKNCTCQLLLHEWTKHDEGHFDLKHPRKLHLLTVGKMLEFRTTLPLATGKFTTLLLPRVGSIAAVTLILTCGSVISALDIPSPTQNCCTVL